MQAPKIKTFSFVHFVYDEIFVKKIFIMVLKTCVRSNYDSNLLSLKPLELCNG